LDSRHFDALTRRLSAPLSRRPLFAAIAGALSAGTRAHMAAAVGTEQKRKSKRKHKKGKAPKPNAYGCLNIGKVCRASDECCSGICEGKKGKRTCRDHNVGPCKAIFDGCATLAVGCGTGGVCFRTTGNASFCGGQGGNCMVCARDADCEATHGKGAACVVCDDCDGIDGSKGTVCYPPAA
jgi:hypothetical protein